jgi:hypothetical protein
MPNDTDTESEGSDYIDSDGSTREMSSSPTNMGPQLPPGYRSARTQSPPGQRQHTLLPNSSRDGDEVRRREIERRTGRSASPQTQRRMNGRGGRGRYPAPTAHAPRARHSRADENDDDNAAEEDEQDMGQLAHGIVCALFMCACVGGRVG